MLIGRVFCIEFWWRITEMGGWLNEGGCQNSSWWNHLWEFEEVFVQGCLIGLMIT